MGSPLRDGSNGRPYAHLSNLGSEWSLVRPIAGTYQEMTLATLRMTASCSTTASVKVMPKNSAS